VRFVASILIALALAAVSWLGFPPNGPARAQSTVTVIGPVTPGDCAAFNSTTVLKDSGVVGCFGPGNLTVSSPIIESVTGSNVKIGFAPCVTPVSGQVVYYTAAWGCAYLIGDVSGNALTGTTVVALQGNAVLCKNPVSGQILAYTNAWVCGNAGAFQGLTASSQIVFSTGSACTVACSVAVVSNVPIVCEIILTGATTCNNGGSSANNGTYTTPSDAFGVRALYLEIEGCGGGGGGAGTGTGSAGNGGNGVATTFGASLLTANGGSGSLSNSSAATVGGAGGTATGGDENLTGGTGLNVASPATGAAGGPGGATVRGGAGPGGVSTVQGAGQPAIANSCAGGGGATGTSGTSTPTGGGGAGGYFRKLIASPASTYLYAVGTGGAGGTTGGTAAGGAGAAGYLRVTARWN
jgi:hypothetical protein